MEIEDRLGVYVVFSGLPGPGAAALLEGALEGVEFASVTAAKKKMLDAVNGACEFVEVEDADGHSFRLREASGWRKRENGTWALGPFVESINFRTLAHAHEALLSGSEKRYAEYEERIADLNEQVFRARAEARRLERKMSDMERELAERERLLRIVQLTVGAVDR